MKSGIVWKIIALTCVAVFAVGVLIFGLSTGFGLDDLIRTDDSAAYETPYTYEEETSALKKVEINWVSGPVSLSFYKGDTVLITETAKHALKEEEKLEWDLSGGELSINWNSAFFHFNVTEADSKALEVQIPEQFSGTLESVKIGTASGDIALEELTVSEATFRTVSGDLELGSIRADTLEIGSTSGQITGENLIATEQIRVGSTSGEVLLTGISADALEIDTTSGNAAVSGSAAELRCKSVSGSLTIDLQAWGETADLSTVSGEVNITAPETADGFTCVFSSVSGDLTCGFEAQKSGDTYTYGGGAAELKISTTSGRAALNREA